LCPITDYTLDSASTAAGVTLTQDSDEVIATFGSAYTATAHVGTHNVEITATASGGASLDFSNTFLTYHWCYAEEADTMTTSFGPYYIPETDHEHEYFPSAYTAWLKPAKVGCDYEFTLTNPSSSNLEIDENTGVLKLTNVATAE
jgi:hypothetical protein